MPLMNGMKCAEAMLVAERDVGADERRAAVAEPGLADAEADGHEEAVVQGHRRPHLERGDGLRR